MSDNQVMSQAEIDGLFSSIAPAKPLPPQPAAHVVAAKAAMQAGGPGPGPRHSDEDDPLRLTVADLAGRLAKAEKALERMSQLETKMEQLSGSLSQVPANMQQMAARFQEIRGQVEDIVGCLKLTPGLAAKKTFQCGHCRTKGYVAVHVQCTQCGKNTLMGWWPARK